MIAKAATARLWGAGLDRTLAGVGNDAAMKGLFGAVLDEWRGVEARGRMVKAVHELATAAADDQRLRAAGRWVHGRDDIFGIIGLLGFGARSGPTNGTEDEVEAPPDARRARRSGPTTERRGAEVPHRFDANHRAVLAQLTPGADGKR